MKIKDLPPKENLGGHKVKTPEGIVGIWKSQWDKGVWLSDGITNQVFPVFVGDLKDVLEWDVDVKDKINLKS